MTPPIRQSQDQEKELQQQAFEAWLVWAWDIVRKDSVPDVPSLPLSWNSIDDYRIVLSDWLPRKRTGGWRATTKILVPDWVPAPRDASGWILPTVISWIPARWVISDWWTLPIIGAVTPQDFIVWDGIGRTMIPALTFSQIQADRLQTNNTLPDYIKNQQTAELVSADVSKVISVSDPRSNWLLINNWTYDIETLLNASSLEYYEITIKPTTNTLVASIHGFGNSVVKIDWDHHMSGWEHFTVSWWTPYDGDYVVSFGSSFDWLYTRVYVSWEFWTIPFVPPGVATFETFISVNVLGWIGANKIRLFNWEGLVSLNSRYLESIIIRRDTEMGQYVQVWGKLTPPVPQVQSDRAQLHPWQTSYINNILNVETNHADNTNDLALSDPTINAVLIDDGTYGITTLSNSSQLPRNEIIIEPLASTQSATVIGWSTDQIVLAWVRTPLLRVNKTITVLSGDNTGIYIIRSFIDDGANTTINLYSALPNPSALTGDPVEFVGYVSVYIQSTINPNCIKLLDSTVSGTTLDSVNLDFIKVRRDGVTEQYVQVSWHQTIRQNANRNEQDPWQTSYINNLFANETLEINNSNQIIASTTGNTNRVDVLTTTYQLRYLVNFPNYMTNHITLRAAHYPDTWVSVVSIDFGDTITVAGNQVELIHAGDTFQLTGSITPSNDGTYIISYTNFDGTNTQIILTTATLTAEAGGGTAVFNQYAIVTVFSNNNHTNGEIRLANDIQSITLDGSKDEFIIVRFDDEINQYIQIGGKMEWFTQKSVTYTQLFALQSNWTLTPGMEYYISDYRSFNYVPWFPIIRWWRAPVIVKATSNNMLATLAKNYTNRTDILEYSILPNYISLPTALWSYSGTWGNTAEIIINPTFSFTFTSTFNPRDYATRSISVDDGAGHVRVLTEASVYGVDYQVYENRGWPRSIQLPGYTGNLLLTTTTIDIVLNASNLATPGQITYMKDMSKDISAYFDWRANKFSPFGWPLTPAFSGDNYNIHLWVGTTNVLLGNEANNIDIWAYCDRLAFPDSTYDLKICPNYVGVDLTSWTEIRNDCSKQIIKDLVNWFSLIYMKWATRNSVDPTS